MIAPTSDVGLPSVVLREPPKLIDPGLPGSLGESPQTFGTHAMTVLVATAIALHSRIAAMCAGTRPAQGTPPLGPSDS